ncbi:MAG: nuclear transport factor 2 family protein [Candidatus Thiodiazotropha sp.]
MPESSRKLIQAYYDAFNRQDMDTFLNLLSDGVVHDINQGSREVGKPAFAAFMSRMNRHYREKLADIVIMTDETGGRAAAEFIVHGEYLATDQGQPGLTSIFVTAGSPAYNLTDWIAQVTSPC